MLGIIISALERLRRADLHEFEDSLIFISNSRTAKATQWEDPRKVYGALIILEANLFLMYCLHGLRNKFGSWVSRGRAYATVAYFDILAYLPLLSTLPPPLTIH